MFQLNKKHFQDFKLISIINNALKKVVKIQRIQPCCAGCGLCILVKEWHMDHEHLLLKKILLMREKRRSFKSILDFSRRFFKDSITLGRPYSVHCDCD